jgi:hypothetical protein
VRNYIKLKNYRPWSDMYAYIDTTAYLADGLFTKHGVKCKFKGEMIHKKFPDYTIVFVVVSRRYTKKMSQIFCELENKVLLYGHKDYVSVCDMVSEVLTKQK